MMQAEAAESAPLPAREPTTAAPSVSTPDEPPAIQAVPRPLAPEPAQLDARALLASTGLQMVETDRSKIVPVLPEEPPVPLGRAPRERPRPVVEEPLQQVETKH